MGKKSMKFEGIIMGEITYHLTNGFWVENGEITHDKIITVENRQTGVSTDIELPVWDNIYTLKRLNPEEYNKLSDRLEELTTTTVDEDTKMWHDVDILACAISCMNQYMEGFSPKALEALGMVNEE